MWGFDRQFASIDYLGWETTDYRRIANRPNYLSCLLVAVATVLWPPKPLLLSAVIQQPVAPEPQGTRSLAPNFTDARGGGTAEQTTNWPQPIKKAHTKTTNCARRAKKVDGHEEKNISDMCPTAISNFIRPSSTVTSVWLAWQCSAFTMIL